MGRKLPFILAATDIGSMIVHRQDVAINSIQQGFGVGWDLVQTADYEAEHGAFISGVLEARRIDHGDGVIAIDCGANVGPFTIRWAKAMTGWGKIIAIEAQERLYYCLAGNIALNNCANARAVWAAVGNADGTMRAPLPNYDEHCSFGSISMRDLSAYGVENIGQTINYSDSAMIDIAVIRLDSLQLPRCDFIKIDVEGMEVDVLDGAIETIHRCQPIIMVEMLKCVQQGIVDRLEAAGYCLSPIDYLNMLAIHQDDPSRRWIETKPAFQPGTASFPLK